MKFSKLNQYKGLIFDLDGTLINSMPYHAKAWKQVANEHGFDIDINDIYRLGGSASIDIARYYLNQGYPVGDPQLYVNRKIDIFLENLQQIDIFDKIMDILIERRNAGVCIALGTGSRNDNVKKVLEAKNMNAYFDVIVTSDDVTKHKPNPDTFLLAAKRMNLKPCECCVFEDGGLGLKAAINGGFDCVEVNEGECINFYELDRS